MSFKKVNYKYKHKVTLQNIDIHHILNKTLKSIFDFL